MHKLSYTRATTRNRRKIKEAFAELLSERGSLKNITVTDLAKSAEITRSTFYNYYDNLYEVGVELQHEVEERLFPKHSIFSTAEDITKYIDELFAFFESQEKIYRELLTSNVTTDYLAQLEKTISQNILASLHERNINDKHIELELLLTINGAIAVVRKHYRNEIDLSLDEIRDHLKIKLGMMIEKSSVGKL